MLASVMEKRIRGHLEKCHVVWRPGRPVSSYLLVSLELEEAVKATIYVMMAMVHMMMANMVIVQGMMEEAAIVNLELDTHLKFIFKLILLKLNI